MLKDFYRLRLPDLAKKNDLTMEVNWNEKDENIKNCQVVKFTFKNGEEAYIKREDLNFFLFTIGTPEDQKKMIPQKLTKVRWYETVVGITATKDIAKGEKISFPIKLSLPVGEEEIIGGLKKVGKSGILIPKNVKS